MSRRFAQRAARDRPHVLVADDYAISGRLTQRLLQIEGYDVRTADNGAAALDLAGQLRPDLVLSDVLFADIDGRTLVRHLRAQAPTHDLRVVAFTAAAMEGDRQAALEAGFDDYLAKPVCAREFLSFVAAQLAGTRARAAA